MMRVEERSVLGSVIRGTHHTGWLLVAVGVLAAVAPVAVGEAVLVLTGLLLLAAAVLLGMFWGRLRELGLGHTMLLIAILAAVAGLVLVIRPTGALSLIRLLLIGYFLLSAVSELMSAWELRREDDAGAMLVAAGVSLLAAVSLWTDWPISGARAVGLLVGFQLATIGWAIARIARRLDAVGSRLIGIGSRLR